MKPDKMYTIWLRLSSGYHVIERSYPGRYIIDVMLEDIKKYNEANRRQYIILPLNQQPNQPTNQG
jgi:hypothetical protein